MKSSIKDFFSKSDQIHSFLRIWSYLLKKSLMKNFIFCAVTKKRCEIWYMWLQFTHYWITNGILTENQLFPPPLDFMDYFTKVEVPTFAA